MIIGSSSIQVSTVVSSQNSISQSSFAVAQPGPQGFVLIVTPLQKFTLPLSEEGILHHSKLVFEEHKLPFHQGFGENVYNLLIYGNILKLNYSLLDHVFDEVIPNLNMLGPVM